jgi:hypothetical protein
MNLYGWRLSAFRQVLGSKDAALLKAATARLSEALRDEAALSKGKAWLQTLVENGCPFRQDRQPLSEPDDGGLLTVQMETEVHVAVIHCLARAIACDDNLDLASESSDWTHPAVGSLHQELVSCGYTRSKNCCVQYVPWMLRLSKGSPLFGDDFRTQWSFYTLFANAELAAMIPVFQAAADFKRPLAKGYPKGAMKKMKMGLSDSGKEFINDLIKWFSQIQQAGQDAFILWS